MDMVERVARAILNADREFKGRDPISDEEWRNYWSPGGPTAMPSAIAMRARAAIEAMPPAMEITDWFARNADRKNPDAFINTNPEYFAQECASAMRAALGEG